MKKIVTVPLVKKQYRSVLVIPLIGAFLFVPHTPAHAATTTPFVYSFNSAGTLYEAGSLSESTSHYFWLNSGAKLIMTGGVGQTVQGSLLSTDKWYKLYAASNPLDTAGGAHPQNLFRLVTKSVWDRVAEQVSFKITRTNVDNTPNRDGYSGILLFSHYKDGNNLYYAGLRMDGGAVIKKKVAGTYTTLAQTTVFPGVYHKTSNPNLIPAGVWMGLKTETLSNADGSVTVNLYLDRTNTGLWTKILSAKDSSRPVSGAGSAGIRTDYMDVQFDNYRLTAL